MDKIEQQPQDPVDPVIGLRASQLPRGETHLIAVVSLQAMAIQQARQAIENVCRDRVDFILRDLGVKFPGHAFSIVPQGDWHGDRVFVTPSMLFAPGDHFPQGYRLGRQSLSDLEALEQVTGMPASIVDAFRRIEGILALMRTQGVEWKED